MKQFGRFIAVGVMNTLLGYAVIFFCMYGLELGAYVSNVIGYAIGLVCSYLLNRIFTFKSSRPKGPELFSFIAVFVAAYGTNLGALKILISIGLNAGLCQILAGAFYISISYFANKYLVFKPGTVLEMSKK